MASTGGSGGDARVTVLLQCSNQPLNTSQSVSFSYHTMRGALTTTNNNNNKNFNDYKGQKAQLSETLKCISLFKCNV